MTYCNLFIYICIYNQISVCRYRDMTPDIYAMSWFITLFARKTPINIVLCLWDIMLQLGDPINLIFIAVAFLCSYREEILLHSNESLPQRLVSLCFQSEEHVKAVTSNALRLKLLTPRTVQTEASKLGFRAKLNEYEREFGIHDLMVAIYCSRNDEICAYLHERFDAICIVSLY